MLSWPRDKLLPAEPQTPALLRPGALYWQCRSVLCVALHDGGATQSCCELTVEYSPSGYAEDPVCLRIADVEGDPAGALWFEVNQQWLIEAWHAHLAVHCAEVAA